MIDYMIDYMIDNNSMTMTLFIICGSAMRIIPM